MENLDEELNNITEDINSIDFGETINLVENPQQINFETVNDVNFEDEYNLLKGRPIDKLELKIGAKTVPRHSCACHKLNLAIRHSIARHPQLCRILRTLAKSNAHIRRSIKLSRVFRKKKCRLRLENLTRWSSAFLVLESVKRAYDRGSFTILVYINYNLKIKTNKLKLFKF
jgi:hypothetical protein